MKTEYLNADEYLASFPIEVQALMNKMRETIKLAAPTALEIISYGMVGYKAYGRALVYFGGFKTHIGFYATPSGHEEFETELLAYKQGKGSVQFPLSNPIPFDLVARIVKYRYEENAKKGRK